MSVLIKTQEMMNKMTKAFPPEILEVVKKVERLAIKIVGNEIIDSDSHVYSSKFGGIPYFPHDMIYPRNDSGEPLALLAQFNLDEIFSDLEILEAHQNDDLFKLYPKTGMLSFFYDILDDEMFGLDEEINNGYKVYYFPEIVKNDSNKAYDAHKELCAVDYYDDKFIPSDWKVSRSIVTSLICTLPDTKDNIPISKELDDYYNLDTVREFINSLRTTDYGYGITLIGGYPFFFSGDGRSKGDNRSVVLLEVNLLDFHGICGVPYFFIAEDDLKNLNFSNVLAMCDFT